MSIRGGWAPLEFRYPTGCIAVVTHASPATVLVTAMAYLVSASFRYMLLASGLIRLLTKHEVLKLGSQPPCDHCLWYPVKPYHKTDNLAMPNFTQHATGKFLQACLNLACQITDA